MPDDGKSSHDIWQGKINTYMNKQDSEQEIYHTHVISLVYKLHLFLSKYICWISLNGNLPFKFSSSNFLEYLLLA